MGQYEYFKQVSSEKNSLTHHGILGQKWGIRRFQNKDGSLTDLGKKHYHTEAVVGNIGRAITNTSVGQRIWGVGVNRGYRKDKKEIKEAYKSQREKISRMNISDEEKGERRKSLKKDYDLTKAEARVSAANALYPWQTDAQNHQIQASKLGKQFVKSFLLGNAGTLTYDRLKAEDISKGKSFAAGFAMEGLNLAITAATARLGGGLLNTADYTYQAVKYSKEQKKKKS